MLEKDGGLILAQTHPDHLRLREQMIVLLHVSHYVRRVLLQCWGPEPVAASVVEQAEPDVTQDSLVLFAVRLSFWQQIPK